MLTFEFSRAFVLSDVLLRKIKQPLKKITNVHNLPDLHNNSDELLNLRHLYFNRDFELKKITHKLHQKYSSLTDRNNLVKLAIQVT